jgi:hypothetical protein
MPSIDDLNVRFEAYLKAHTCPSPSFLIDLYADNQTVESGLPEWA